MRGESYRILLLTSSLDLLPLCDLIKQKQMLKKDKIFKIATTKSHCVITLLAVMNFSLVSNLLQLCLPQ